MSVTIICDASYCPETGIAGFGYWIASDRGKLGNDGVFVGTLANNIAAEMMAVVLTMREGLAADLIHYGERLLVQTDCQAAIDAFKGFRSLPVEQEAMIVDWYHDLIREHGLEMEFRHIPAHTGDQAVRSRVNAICDRQARKQMRNARDAHNMRQLSQMLKGKQT